MKFKGRREGGRRLIGKVGDASTKHQVLNYTLKYSSVLKYVKDWEGHSKQRHSCDKAKIPQCKCSWWAWVKQGKVLYLAVMTGNLVESRLGKP